MLLFPEQHSVNTAMQTEGGTVDLSADCCDVYSFFNQSHPHS